MMDDAAAQVILSEMSLRGRLPGMRPVNLDRGASVYGVNPLVEDGILSAKYGVVKDCSALGQFTIATPGSGSYVSTATISSAWSTEGGSSLLLQSSTTATTNASTQANASFTLDCTDLDYIYFDSNVTERSAQCGAYLYIDGGSQVSIPLGETLNAQIDVRSLSGNHTFQFRTWVWYETGSTQPRAARMHIDNIRAKNTPLSAGCLLKSISRLKLDRIVFPKIYKPVSTKCQVDILGASVRANIVADGAVNYITLDAGASAVDDAYNGKTIVLKTGTGAGQSRIITDYVGSNKRAYVADPLSTVPTAGTTFEIFDTIAMDVQPGFDLQTIDYTAYPTINILCSLEKMAGATAAPSMGVPVVTSVKNDWVSQTPVHGTANSTTPVTLLSTNTGPAKVDRLSGWTTVNSSTKVTVIADGITVIDDVTVGSGTSATAAYPFEAIFDIVAESSLTVTMRATTSNGPPVTGATLTWSR